MKKDKSGKCQHQGGVSKQRHTQTTVGRSATVVLIKEVQGLNTHFTISGSSSNMWSFSFGSEKSSLDS